METLIRNYIRLIDSTPVNFQRYLYNTIDWQDRLIGITGARGTGKTTLLLQYIKNNFTDRTRAIYVSLDNIWFAKNSLTDLVEYFYTHGGTHLFLDEVHRYPNWSIEIKNIYDSYPEIHIIFTGSSILEIYKSNADLSRRAIHYHLQGLSLREYLKFEHDIDLPPLSLSDILNNHLNIASEITSKIKILPLFEEYLKQGYYPFYKENSKNYLLRLQNMINTILDYDLPAVENIEYTTLLKIKKILMIISSLVPFTPNMTSLSAEIETNRTSSIKYLSFLEKAKLIKMLPSSKKGMNSLNKPEKIYLDNTNLLYALTTSNINDGNKRETFFANQVAMNHTLTIPPKGDFLVDNIYTFEIGEKNKNYDQIKDIPDSYVVFDNAETGFGNKIPLWLFGMMY
ncbi:MULTISPECIES: ATP-binding protein [Butyricimonas]|uniref:ATP-binding protein n=1 Tax=Butyricimonas TaxID=574697 RepID=UPI00242EFEB5|nr:AAA family ATPase [Butyricimonas paravirosa]